MTAGDPTPNNGTCRTRASTTGATFRTHRNHTDVTAERTVTSFVAGSVGGAEYPSRTWNRRARPFSGIAAVNESAKLNTVHDLPVRTHPNGASPLQPNITSHLHPGGHARRCGCLMSPDEPRAPQHSHGEERPVASALSDLAGLLLETDSFHTVMQRLAEASTQIVPNVLTGGITVANGGRIITVAAADALGRELDERQYDIDEGPCLEAMYLKRSSTPQTWPPKPGGVSIPDRSSNWVSGRSTPAR